MAEKDLGSAVDKSFCPFRSTTTHRTRASIRRSLLVLAKLGPLCECTTPLSLRLVFTSSSCLFACSSTVYFTPAHFNSPLESFTSTYSISLCSTSCRSFHPLHMTCDAKDHDHYSVPTHCHCTFVHTTPTRRICPSLLSLQAKSFERSHHDVRNAFASCSSPTLERRRDGSPR